MRCPIVKISRFLLIFVLFAGWIFSGWPRIWQEPSIPPKIQEARAETAYYDPISDAVAGGWSCTGADCGTGHYAVLDDGIRQPNAPGISDYIYTTSNSGAANEEHQVDAITQSGINYLRLYYYASTGARANINIMLQSDGVTQASYLLPPDSNAAWRYVQWDASSVGTITGEFMISDSGTGKPGTGTIYAWYIEIDYTSLATSFLIGGTEVGTKETAVTIITFPEGSPEETIEAPYNNVDTDADPQVLSTTVSEPVVKIKNTHVSATYNVVLGITTWTNSIVNMEYYNLAADGVTNISTATAELSNANGAARTVSTGVSIAAGTYKDLYLKLMLGSVAGKTGTSTLTILGETP